MFRVVDMTCQSYQYFVTGSVPLRERASMLSVQGSFGPPMLTKYNHCNTFCVQTDANTPVQIKSSEEN